MLRKSHVLILLTILISPNCFGQNYIYRGKKFLLKEFEKCLGQQKEIDSLSLSQSGRFVILESTDPTCYVVFDESTKNQKIVAFSIRNGFSYNSQRNPISMMLLDGLKFKSSNEVLPLKSLVKRIPVGPLIKTRWNQDTWYNRYCPYDIRSKAGENTYAGCVTVGMCQIIKHYGNHMDFIIDASHSYKDCALQASALPYNWDEMINQPLNYEMEIGRLMADFGILIHTSFGYTSSSASTGLARKGINELGFKNAYKVERHNYEIEEWLELFYSNLERYSPILVAGKGHAFVCDGYNDNGMLHFNLGGGGTGDGYYDPNSVYGIYCTNEAVLDIMPEIDFNPPELIRKEMINNSLNIVWSPPSNNQVPQSYKIFYSEDDYFVLQDTIYPADQLKPGSHGVRVSAIYPDGESLEIGPVWVSNPGEAIEIQDPAIRKALQDYPYPAPTNESYNFVESQIYDQLSITIEDSIQSTEILGDMKRLQKLAINGAGLQEQDLEFISNLKYLQTLHISNVNCDILPNLTDLQKLVELKLDSCAISDLSFLSGLSNLIVLKFNYCNLMGLDFPDSLPVLECLSIKNTAIEDLSFLNIKSIRNLELSSCNIDSFEPPNELSKLTCLNLENNNLSTTNFISQLPFIKEIKAANNRITQLDIHSQYYFLKTLDLSHNDITHTSISFDLPDIEDLDLSFNELVKFPAIFSTMSNLKSLNLSNNKIDEIPRMKLNELRQLDISENNLNHINNIYQHEAIEDLNLDGNAISDFSPLTTDAFHKNLKKLSIRDNPISKESFYDILPLISATVDSLFTPDNYEPNSPCYPIPGSPSKITNRNLQISWYCEVNDPTSRYRFYFGVGDSIHIINPNLNFNQIDVRLDQGQVYNWQVETLFQDTSFFSGIYEIRTTNELEIPYLEDFELFQNGENITAESSNWRLTNGVSDVFQDGIISDAKKQFGNIRSLNLLSSSNVTIDLDHIELGTLIIEYDQFVPFGQSAHICLKNLHGLDINILTSADRSEILTNGHPDFEFQVNPNRWNRFRISLQGKNNIIVISCNGDFIWSKRWGFHNSVAQIDGLVFSKSNLENHSTITSYNSYIDNLAIYDPNMITHGEVYPDTPPSIKIFPNPASGNFFIRGLPDDPGEINLILRSSSGQEVLRQKIKSSNGEIGIPVYSIPSGTYYYQMYSRNSILVSGKILILN